MVTNFLNALDRIPKLMEQYKSQNATIEKDLPTLREILGGTWKKEEELKGLKSEVATLERKIQLTPSSSKLEAEQEQTGGEMVHTLVAEAHKAEDISSPLSPHQTIRNPIAMPRPENRTAKLPKL